MALLNQRQFAESIGVSEMAVSKAIKKGILNGAIRKKGKRRLIIEKTAKRLWLENHDPARGGKNGGGHDDDDKDDIGGESYSDLRKRTEKYKAKLKRLDYLIKSGQYVELEKVQRSAFAVSRSIRDAVLAIGPRLAPILAAESDIGIVGQTLDRELNLALADLSGHIKSLGEEPDAR